ncbi:MAG: class I SAM-dependent methyltransferase [Paludibacter sp.]|nr:class I SAM-dependent methyltransferase [Paludibacter sp.]
MNHFRVLYKYLCHFITARNTGGYGVHSPFLFQFTRFVLREKHAFYSFQSIENLRSALRKDNREVHITDFGTGTDRSETISRILAKAVQSPKYSQLLFRIIHYFKAQHILELGTSLGITTAYLASVSSDSECVSLEGSPEIAAVAKENLRKLKLSNVEIVVGDIDTTLADVLAKAEKLDFVYFDANHRSEAVLNFFKQCLPKAHKQTVMVFDDIYWSDDMEHAWDEIKSHPAVNSTIDLFQLGIVFFNDDLHKKHYKMRY